MINDYLSIFEVYASKVGFDNTVFYFLFSTFDNEDSNNTNLRYGNENFFCLPADD
jgi:hypothetical protein